MSGKNQIIVPFDITSVVKRHAPLVRFHPDEQFFPSSVPWFLNRVEMWFRKPVQNARKHFDASVIVKFRKVNPTSLTSQVQRGYRSDASPISAQIQRRKGTYFLNIPETPAAAKTRAGEKGKNTCKATCYVHVQKSERSGCWWLVYLFFYPYNGSISSLVSSAHEGDWEHIRVEVDNLGHKIHSIYMAAHEGGKCYRRYSTKTPGRVGYRHLDRGSHPIVYSARHSHATYPTRGEVPLGLATDHTGNGREWRTWDSLEILGDLANPGSRHQWLKFNGLWGQVWGSPIGLTGPTGPAFKSWWQDNRFA